MSNPLLDTSLLGEDRLPRFDLLKPEHVLPAIRQLIGAYQSGLDTLLQNDRDLNWDELVERELDWTDRIAQAWSQVSHLSNVKDSDALRAVYREAMVLITQQQNERAQNERLYRAYRRLGGEKLDQKQQRLIELELRDFERSGVTLNDKKKQRYRELTEEMTQLSNRFSENVLDATYGWFKRIDDENQLRGLPKNEKNLLRNLAEKQHETGWLIDLSYPSYFAVMTYADDRALRETVHHAYVTRASDRGPNAGEWDNRPAMMRLLSLRQELAGLLGFSDYPDYAIAVRMAESAEQVRQFLEGLLVRARPAAERQFAELSEFAREQGGPDALQVWDVAYWSEKLRRQNYAISQEELQPYFAVPQVLDGLLDIAGRLFGLRFSDDASPPLWHRDVRYLTVSDSAGKAIGGLYLDLYARSDKRGGAWMDVCRSRRRTAQRVQTPIAFLCCNFSPPSAGQPSLLNFRDVETLFHEFGHCLHHVLTEVDWPPINGISNVEWDAVELPSQIMENWCLERESLLRFARHYRTEKPMPDPLYRKLWRSRNFQKAMQLVRQLEFAIVDMELHLEQAKPRPRPPQEIMDAVRARVAVAPSHSEDRFLNAFSHLFGGGYAAGYYSYLWAEQLAADAFERFRDEGLMNASIGASLRREILAAGASRPALESFVAFRGRSPSIEPLLASYDIRDV